MENFRVEMVPEPDAQSNLPQGLQDPGQTRRAVLRFLLDVVETLVLSLVLFLAINALSARIRVESISMQPTLYEGDFVIVNRIAYKLGNVGRGDVIVFHYPPDPEQEPYIKRVIGLPGDQVQVQNGKVFVNDVPLYEPYIKADPNYNGIWEIPNDSLFVLGDNRNNSSDSHSWGMVPLENIIGRAEVVYWPPSEWQVLNPSVAIAAPEEP